MITGSIVALVTPMHPNGEIDWSSYSGLIEWHIAMGTAAIVPVGTTGESATVSVAEHCKIVEHAVQTVAGRVPVIAGTGGNATDEAIELTAAAKKAGASPVGFDERVVLHPCADSQGEQACGAGEGWAN